MTRPVRFALLLGALLAGDVAGAWEDPNQTVRGMRDRLLVRVGGYAVNYDTELRYGSGTIVGTLVRVEEALNLASRSEELRVDGHWRFGTRRGLEFTAFDLDRSAVNLLDLELAIEDTVYRVGALLESRLRTSFVKTNYRWSFVNEDKIDLGFTAGLSVIDLTFRARGVGRLVDDDGKPLWQGDGDESFRFTAPVPVVGQFVRLSLGHRLFYHAGIDLFLLRWDDFDVYVIDARTGIDWFLTKHFGVSLSYNFMRMEYDEDDPNERLNVEYTIDGLVFQVGFAF